MLTAWLLFMLAQQATEAEQIDWDKEFGVETHELDPATGEMPVAPYLQSNANAGAKPFDDTKLAAMFGGKTGIEAIAVRTIELSETDPRIERIFISRDTIRLKRTLFEQLCYILNAGCDYTGQDMAQSHKDMGIEYADMNALVENLQQAMRERKVPFPAQNRLLAKLAPMSRDIIER